MKAEPAGPATRPRDIKAEWATFSAAVVPWILAHLVNRTDRHGRYKPRADRDPADPLNWVYTEVGPLTAEILQRHMTGRDGWISGVHTTSAEETCRWLCIDVDAHDATADPEANWRFAVAVFAVLVGLGFRPLLIDSNGRGGYHVWALFDGPIPAELARRFGLWLVREWERFGVKTEPEVFPKQAKLKGKKIGNWVRLFGPHHTREDHWSRVWDDGCKQWLDGRLAIKFIVATDGTDAGAIPEEARRHPLVDHEPTEAKPAKAAGAKSSGRRAASTDDLALADSALKALPAHYCDAYHPWLLVGFALRSLGNAGLALWIDWSRGSDKFQQGACEAKWATMGADEGISLGSLFYWAKQAGWEMPRTTPLLGGKRRSAAADVNGPTDDAAAETERAGFNRTDMGNAQRLAHRYGSDLRYCHKWGKWIAWDRWRWKEDGTGRVQRAAKKTVRKILVEASYLDDPDERKDHAKWHFTSENKKRVDAMIGLAQSDLPVEPEHFDADPWSLNCKNGTLDLRTGEIRPHRREDYISKLCPVEYHPDAPCPLWESALLHIFERDERLIGFWQRLWGYILTGLTTEQSLPILHGRGANGKSTLLTVLSGMLGPDYAMKAAQNFLMVKRANAHPTELADLFGKRLVVAIETGEGMRINETLVKELTGGDRIRARRMREDLWEFGPTHKVILCTNHKPVIRGTDHAIWRRLCLVPFNVTIPEDKQDRHLPEKLLAELPGILAWCVRGCLEWQRSGLEPPEVVQEATETYRKAEDALGAFLAEHCFEDPGNEQVRVKAGHLYDRYKAAMERGGDVPLNIRRFGEAIMERGIEKRMSDGTWYLGLGLRADGEPPY